MALPAAAPEQSERLSLLQKRVLLQACINRYEPHAPESRGADVCLGRLLAEVYDLRPEPDGQQQLNGKRRYATAAAAISRALRRLEMRGLIVYFRGGYKRPPGCSLTAAGQQLILKWVEERKRLRENADQSETVMRPGYASNV